MKSLAIKEKSRATNLEPIARLKKLTSLRVMGNDIKDISSLLHASWITDLTISSTKITDFTPLGGLTKLRSLDLSHSNIADIKPLSGLASLQKLIISHTTVKDFKPIGAIESLYILDLSHTSFSDLALIKPLKQLSALFLEGTSVTDIGAFSELKELTELYLSGLPIKSIAPLASLNIMILDICNTPIESFDVLTSFSNLRRLYVNNTGFCDLKLLGDNAFENLRFLGTPISFEQTLRFQAEYTSKHKIINRIPGYSDFHKDPKRFISEVNTINFSLEGLENVLAHMLYEVIIETDDTLLGDVLETSLKLPFNNISDEIQGKLRNKLEQMVKKESFAAPAKNLLDKLGPVG